jgi:hypothetical protein
VRSYPISIDFRYIESENKWLCIICPTRTQSQEIRRAVVHEETQEHISSVHHTVTQLRRANLDEEHEQSRLAFYPTPADPPPPPNNSAELLREFGMGDDLGYPPASLSHADGRVIVQATIAAYEQDEDTDPDPALPPGTPSSMSFQLGDLSRNPLSDHNHASKQESSCFDHSHSHPDLLTTVTDPVWNPWENRVVSLHLELNRSILISSVMHNGLDCPSASYHVL